MDANVLRPTARRCSCRGPLAALVAWAALPSSALACKGGDFCLYRHADRGGGEYIWTGNDGNLHNDLFARGVKVGDNATTVHNAGHPDDPSGRIDVLAYTNPGSGARRCACRTGPRSTT